MDGEILVKKERRNNNKVLHIIMYSLAKIL